jgi:hypothetical protein
MAQRFADLNITSLVVARMDVTDDAPPSRLNLLQHTLPVVMLLTAEDKNPPWNFYSGVGKVQTMMKWVEKYASIPFTLPNLPHLKESDRVAYKTQVREREEYLEEKRKKDQEAMEEEERKKQELLVGDAGSEQEELFPGLREFEEMDAPEINLEPKGLGGEGGTNSGSRGSASGEEL